MAILAAPHSKVLHSLPICLWVHQQMHYFTVQVVGDDDHGECWCIVCSCFLIEKYHQLNLHNVKTTLSQVSVMQLPNAASTKAQMNAHLAIGLPPFYTAPVPVLYNLWLCYYSFSQLVEIQYGQKYWQGIKFGELPV